MHSLDSGRITITINLSALNLKMLLIFLLLTNLIALNLMEMITEDHCDAEDDADIARRFTQAYEFLYKNQNNSQQIDKVFDKTQEINEKLNLCLKDQQQQQKILELETQVSTLLEENYDLRQQLQEIQQNTNGNIADINDLKQQVREIKQKTNKNYTIIQRRQDGSVDFYRNWYEYKRGFGNATGEFFIGLQKLHELTNSRPYELLIIMEDWKFDRRYAKYDYFVVGSENENFVLKSIGTYSGTAGDSLSKHVHQKFSTKDRDQDAWNGLHCAQKYKGAWWYHGCFTSNLNGEYFKDPYTKSNLGVTWYKFKGDSYSLKFVEMILMPK